MAITGTLAKYGTFYVGNFSDEPTSPVDGILVTLDADNVYEAAALLNVKVEIWPVCAPDLAPGECTPENYAHLKARLADAADNLAREVRSNQAAALVRAGLEARLQVAEKSIETLEAQGEQLAADLAEALGKVKALREIDAPNHTEVDDRDYYGRD